MGKTGVGVDDNLLQCHVFLFILAGYRLLIESCIFWLPIVLLWGKSINLTHQINSQNWNGERKFIVKNLILNAKHVSFYQFRSNID